MKAAILTLIKSSNLLPKNTGCPKIRVGRTNGRPTRSKIRVGLVSHVPDDSGAYEFVVFNRQLWSTTFQGIGLYDRF